MNWLNGILMGVALLFTTSYVSALVECVVNRKSGGFIQQILCIVGWIVLAVFWK